MGQPTQTLNYVKQILYDVRQTLNDVGQLTQTVSDVGQLTQTLNDVRQTLNDVE